MNSIAFGTHLPVIGFTGDKTFSRDQLISYAQKAEELGYDSLSVNDHIIHRTSRLDAICSLSAIAATTHKIKIGTSILNLVIRNPVVCAKALCTIDIMSAGRLFVGLGEGSRKEEYDACGIPFEERWKRFSEALEVIYALWSDEDRTNSPLVDYEGKYYKLKGVSMYPKPIQKPRPPIIISSWGSEQGLRRVAKYGDGWMASAVYPVLLTPDKFGEKWRLLLSYRRELNKDVESFENSVMTMFGYIDNDKEKVHRMAKEILSPVLGRSADELENLLLFGSPEQCLKKINDLYESGAKRIHFWPVNDYIEQIEIFFKEIAQKFN